MPLQVSFQRRQVESTTCPKMIGLQTKEEYTDREIDPNQGEAQIDEDDQPGNIAKEAKDDELQAKGKGLLLLPDAPQHHHEQGHLGGGDKEG